MRFLFPSPLVGEEARAKARAGEGALFKSPLTRLVLRLRCALATLSHEGRG